MNREVISPYSFPGIDVDLLDPIKYPFINKYRQNSTIEQVYHTVFLSFGVKREDVMSKSRKQELVYCRMTLSFIFRNIMGMSYKRVGVSIGNRDHASAMHNEKTFIDIYTTSRDFKERADKVFEKLKITEKKLELIIKNKIG